MTPVGSGCANSIGDLPPRFTQVRRLGDGAEGGTFAAIDTDAGARRVVLKPIAPSRRDASKRAFDTLRRVASPHLPEPIELLVSQTDDTTWLVTAWIEGDTLGPGPVPAEQALAEARGIAHALLVIHRSGTHHGDVSPGNVIITPTHGVVLVDLAELGALGRGTPGYLAPEVLGGAGGPAADCFALGSILCWRLFGDVPWRQPGEVAQARDAHARVRALAEAAGVAIDPGLGNLVAGLIEPDLGQRLQDAAVVVDRLTHLHAACVAGIESVARPWSLPSRFVYRGVDLDPVIARMCAPRPPRLVAVVGAEGSGRARIVEELVQRLQLRGHAVHRCDSTRIATALHRAGDRDWMSAWLDASADVGETLGVLDTPPWPNLPVSEPGLRSEPERIADVLAAAAALARVALIVPVDVAIGAALERCASDDVALVRVACWDIVDVESTLDGILDPSERSTWAKAILAVAGSEPARVVRCIRACARAGVHVPSEARVRDAVARHGQSDDQLDPLTAHRVLTMVWGGDSTRLDPSLHDGARPYAWVHAAARRSLGTELEAAAAAMLAERRQLQQPIGIALAIDADDVDAMAALLGCDHDLSPALDVPLLSTWLQRGGYFRLPAEARVRACRELLRAGAPSLVVELVTRSADPGAGEQLEHARALQQLGRTDAARALLVADTRPWTADLAARRRALSWRLDIDAGQAREVYERAKSTLCEIADPSPGLALCFAWAGMAASMCDAYDDARTWLEQAREMCAAVAERGEATAVLARVLQLLGNLEHRCGGWAQASRFYTQAAAAFVDAGESLGGSLLAGSLAGLALITGDASQGARQGRIAVRHLLATGQVQTLPHAALNLVQLLTRIGKLDEAIALTHVVERLIGATPAVSRRMRAEVAAAVVMSDARCDATVATKIAETFAASARAFEQIGGQREAAEAWWRACTWFSRAGNRASARQALDHGRGALAGVDDPLLELSGCIAAVRLAWVGEDGELDRALQRLDAATLRHDPHERGELELAWTAERIRLRSLRRLGRPSEPRSVSARRLRKLWEELMMTVEDGDYEGRKAALLGDAGDNSPVRDLLLELAAVGQNAAAHQTHDDAPHVVARSAGVLEKLLRIYRRLAREHELERLLEQVADAMMELSNAERGVVVVRPLQGTQLLEVTRELAAGSDAVKFSRSVIDKVIETGEPVVSVDAAEDARFDGAHSVSHLNLRSVLAVPLISRGEVLGAAYVDHRLRRGNFDADALTMMEAFADLAALAVAHARALGAVRSQANELEQQRAELSRRLAARDVEVEGLRAHVRSAASLSERNEYRGMVGQSPAMQRVFQLIDRVAERNVSIVIEGESGTGKELVARAVHDAGPRKERPFIAENCSAIPETLLESVLFGHAKGAFTGADRSRPGLFEAAHGGTLFLDEVADMSPGMQTKLLRVLQEGEVRRVGENQSRPVDVRVIAASNRSLERLVSQGVFRSDLYYRINVVKIVLPNLRDRRDDLPALIQYLLRRHAPERDIQVTGAAMKSLLGYAWPGNVRELDNEVQRWIALVEDRVDHEDLSASIRGAQALDVLASDDLNLRPRVERLERDLIERALRRTSGNQTRAAALLGLSRFGLQKKLRRLDLDAAPRGMSEEAE